ncbi:MAG: winged helix-turn-helix domain-containing protein [Candidatus Acidiferrales bacterium]|jgi:DNA-binding winged helix-turn-helix (wHTH) protein/tetratricopeptide (TPR) repeat protein
MANAWSANVLVLTVQLDEFRGVAGGVCRDGTYVFRGKQLVVKYRHVTNLAMEAAPQTRRTRFGPFEVDLRSGEIHKHGIRLKLQDQPFQVLAVLLEHPGEVVTRDELHQKLWPADTFVDFDTGLNSAIKKLRDVLSDSADEPRYIETLHRRGYRFIAPVENGAAPKSAPSELRVVPVPAPASPKPRQPWYQRRVVVAAGIAGLLVVAALVTWRVFFARPVLSEADVILVASFVNKTGDPIFDNSLDKALEVKLTESPFLSLFSEANVRETLRMMRHDPNERVTPELGIEICKRQGLKALVVPEIAAVGNTYLITLEAIDARNQKPIARSQEVAESKDKVVAALGKAGSQLRRQLGESLSSLEKYNAPLDLATTSSLDALLAYRAGQNLYRSGKRRESIPFFERAVDLDPQFCSAYNMLGSAYHSIDNGQASRENFAKAFELKDRRLTQEENFLTTALYDSSITGNLEKETTVLVLYKEAYPRSVSAYNLLGIAYAQQGRTEEALQNFNWAIAHSPVPSAQHYSNASQALMILGRFDEAKKMLDEWRQKGSLTPFQREMRYRIAFIEKDAVTMDQLARETSADDVTWLHLQMQLAFLRGDSGTLRSISDTLVNQASRANRTENVSDELARHASLESFLGDYASARKLCRLAEEANNDSAIGMWTCAKALGTAGDVSQAEALVAKLDQRFPEDTFQQKVLLPIARSIIERERGNPVKAVALLVPVTQYPNGAVSYHRGQAYLAAGEYGEAVADFKTVIAHRGWPEWEIFSPLAQLGLARAYAKQGDTDLSRKAYDDFFTTWKDADPDIPILVQAKAEYKKLAATASAAASASP